MHDKEKEIIEKNPAYQSLSEEDKKAYLELNKDLEQETLEVLEEHSKYISNCNRQKIQKDHEFKVENEEISYEIEWYRYWGDAIEEILDKYFQPMMEDQPDNPKLKAVYKIYKKAFERYEEIFTLCENGYTQGAYALTRMLYELWTIEAFIERTSPKTAEAFIKAKDDLNIKDNWALASGVFDKKGKKRSTKVSFSDIERWVWSIEPEAQKEWRQFFNVMSKVVHPNSISIFKKLGEPGSGSYFTEPEQESKKTHANQLQPLRFSLSLICRIATQALQVVSETYQSDWIIYDMFLFQAVMDITDDKRAFKDDEVPDRVPFTKVKY